MTFLAALLVFGATTLTDLRHRRIPNELVLAVIALALIRMGTQWELAGVVEDVKAAGLVLLGALVFWRLRWLGGGDVKLIFAGALLVGAPALPDFLVLTVLVGGVLGALAFVDMWLERTYGWSAGIAFPRASMAVRDASISVPRKAAVPYGIAISLGCLATLFATSFSMR